MSESKISNKKKVDVHDFESHSVRARETEQVPEHVNQLDFLIYMLIERFFFWAETRPWLGWQAHTLVSFAP